MIKNRGIAFRLAVPVLIGAAFIFLVIFGVGYFHSRDTILRNMEESARNLAHRIAYRIESVLAPVEKVPMNLAMVIENFEPHEPKILETLRRTLIDNPEIYGSTVAFEPNSFDPGRQYYAPYLSRNGKELRISYLGGENYRYFHQDWYQIPRETGKPCWSEPYFDEGGGEILMATYSLPFFGETEGGRQVAGVITADISLEWLEKIVSEIRIYQTGYGFIISRNGTFVTHPEKRWGMNETIFSVGEARSDTVLREIGRRMIKGESGFGEFTGDHLNRRGFLFFAPIGVSNWSLGIFFPEDELMAELKEFNRKGVYLAIAGLLLLVLVVWLVSRTITRPLTALSGAAGEMATGNLEVDVPGLNRGGEVGVLARSFHHMKESLKVHIRELLETNATRERIESELNIAREIQMGLLPKIFPPFPDVSEFDLYALIKPAREVGGDLYDFYRVGDHHVCFVLGDVSGKGIAASLFMAVTMTLVKTTAAHGLNPHEILREVNAQLSRDNASAMFVTLFCGILNTRTGELRYANGGHNLPVLLRKNGEVVFLEGTDGILLGAMAELEYEMKETFLAEGDGLFVYSDGVTEAMDRNGTLYSEERLLSRLSDVHTRSACEIVEAVMRDVTLFEEGSPQADDIAMLTVRYCGNSRPE